MVKAVVGWKLENLAGFGDAYGMTVRRIPI